MTHGLQTGFSGYGRFSKLTMFDENALFSRLSEPIQQMLVGVSDGRSSTHKRFSFPLRPFEREYPRALGLRGCYN